MAKLTAKQQRFCDEYLIDLNATQAAIRAGYSKKTAYKASDWLNEKSQEKPSSKFNRAMREYIDNRLAEKEKALIADQNEVLKYLTATMRREKKECIVVTTSEERSMYVPDDNGTMRKQTVKKETPQIVEIPARLSDANKAAELLGKAYGLYTEKVEADVDMDLNINIDYGDDDDTSGGGVD